MSEWAFAAAAEGWLRIHGGAGEASPSAEDHDALVEKYAHLD